MCVVPTGDAFGNVPPISAVAPGAERTCPGVNKGGKTVATATQRKRGVDRTAWAQIETKPFFMTSEFLFYALMTIALLITAASDNSIDARWFWLLEVPLTIGYLVSRGLAKAGSRTPSYDPRDEALTRARNRIED
jgi:hypothetical protein